MRTATLSMSSLHVDAMDSNYSSHRHLCDEHGSPGSCMSDLLLLMSLSANDIDISAQ